MCCCPTTLSKVARPVSDAEVTEQKLVGAWASLTTKMADEVSGVAAHLLKNTVPELTAVAGNL